MQDPSQFYRLLKKKKSDISAGNPKLKAFLIHKAYERLKKPVLIISPAVEEACSLRDMLETLYCFEGDVQKPVINMLDARSSFSSSYSSSSSDGNELYSLTALYGFLHAILSEKNTINIIDYQSLFMPMPSPLQLMDNSFEITAGKKVDREDLLSLLYKFGYKRSDLVVEGGEYSTRGFIIDVFIPSDPFPVRIELDEEDTCISLRSFDCLSQRSIKPIEGALILPVRPLFAFFSEDHIENFGKGLQISSYAQGERINALLSSYREPVFKDCEILSCLLYDSCIFDYLSDDTVVILDEKADFTEFANSYKPEFSIALPDIQCRHDRIKNLIMKRVEDEYRFSLNLLSEGKLDENIGSGYLDNYSGNHDKFLVHISDWISKKFCIIIVLPSIKLISNLKGILESKSIKAKVSVMEDWRDKEGIYILKGEISRGLLIRSFQTVIISETEIFGHRFESDKPERKRDTPDLNLLLRLKVNDYVIHSTYGVGRYMGIRNMEVKGSLIDFVEIIYKEDDKLYIPVYNLNSIHRYASSEKEIALDRLKSSRFLEKKQKIREKLLTYASEIMDLYAKRSLKKGYSFERFIDYEDEFDSHFLYEETDDQYRATSEIKADMTRESPMDRVLIGDVGFGKTEVIMRAVYLAVLNNKQVAVLVPTTVLAQQHYITFQDRFKGTALSIEMLSRFTGNQKEKAVLDKITGGQLDVVIGTHRILSGDIKFRDLGLLIIDEEHKFGVKHKESLKFLKEEVDTITLTATPIPRTYYMSISGLRDISFIATPPRDRLAIKTQIIEKQDHLIRNAILSELHRKGQIFFVHNRVQSIYSIERWLKELVPEARILVGHAQMRDSQLERVMLDFLERKYDLLLCTTIIESGLDIPNVNTIFIDNADKFGLAQLYQLRGRVGRTNLQAYAYLIIKSKRKLTGDGRLRMQAIMNLSELGAGFQLAGYDLDIRGAGNLVGKEQSGHIEQLGIEYYTRMLRETVEELKGNPAMISEYDDVEIKLDKSAYIPPLYIPDVSERFSFYKRLSNSRNHEHLEIVCEELRDRFGPVPRELNNVVLINRLRINSAKKGIKSITSHGNLLLLLLSERNTIKLDKLLKLVKDNKNKYKLKESQLIIALKDNSLKGIIDECQFLYERIFE